MCEFVSGLYSAPLVYKSVFMLVSYEIRKGDASSFIHPALAIWGLLLFHIILKLFFLFMESKALGFLRWTAFSL